MNEESQVSGCCNITFNYTSQKTVCVGKDTSKQNINMKANVKIKNSNYLINTITM